ncbi:hypothetical protein CDL15_Pgr027230 [Punica granatum]|uniref:Uncharacterized protein n=1 Tax=Punica granatum TaxID=22663 RepID=A0A218XMC6_PUNGR|nr:hypothetical protein CDL15_Pgr027230 [Punica granatum]
MLGDYCEVLRDRCGLCFPWKYPKVCREAFVTTETHFGRPSRVPEGCLKLAPRPWWSLGACKPVLRGRLLVSGANPGSSVGKGVLGGSGCPGLSRMPRKCEWGEPRELCQKRRPWGIGVSRLKQDAPEMRPDVSLVTLALRGIFGVPYWAPFGASVTR